MRTLVVVSFLAVLLTTLPLSALDSYPPDNGKKAVLYADADAREMAKKASKVVPMGDTKTKRAVLLSLGIDPRRLRGYRFHAAKMIIVEWWQISPGYRLQWLAGVDQELSKESCPVYGVEIKRIEPDSE